jgi:hypothetical protein
VGSFTDRFLLQHSGSGVKRARKELLLNPARDSFEAPNSAPQFALDPVQDRWSCPYHGVHISNLLCCESAVVGEGWWVRMSDAVPALKSAFAWPTYAGEHLERLKLRASSAEAMIAGADGCNDFLKEMRQVYGVEVVLGARINYTVARERAFKQLIQADRYANGMPITATRVENVIVADKQLFCLVRDLMLLKRTLMGGGTSVNESRLVRCGRFYRIEPLCTQNDLARTLTATEGGPHGRHDGTGPRGTSKRACHFGPPDTIRATGKLKVWYKYCYCVRR